MRVLQIISSHCENIIVIFEQYISSEIYIVLLIIVFKALLIKLCCLARGYLPVKIVSTSWTLCLLVEPWHDALCMEVMSAPKEEDLITFGVVTHADCTHKIFLEFLHLLGLQLANKLVFHSMILFDLVVHLFVPDLFKGFIVHARDR